MIEKPQRLPSIEDTPEYSNIKVLHGMDEFKEYPDCPNLYLTHEVSNTPDPKLLRHRSQKSFKYVLFLVILYSGVHAGSWKTQFPTIIEQMWWRIAIFVIAGGGLVLWLFQISVKFYRNSAGRI
jgi:hypothetical protein